MLQPRLTPQASVIQTQPGWRLEIPAGKAGNYRLAQLDDYSDLPRKRFPLQDSAFLRLRSRVSSATILGTWGFGFWNDPFAFDLGFKRNVQRLPVLPNACWYFHASPENHLSLDDHHSGNGFLTQTFRSPKIPSLFLTPTLLGLPLLYSQAISIWLRAISRAIIKSDSKVLKIDTTQWHTYQMDWQHHTLVFKVDDSTVFQTTLCPRTPLGVVIWIDNQFARWNPSGKIGFGTLSNPETSWLEIEDLQIRY